MRYALSLLCALALVGCEKGTAPSPTSLQQQLAATNASLSAQRDENASLLAQVASLSGQVKALQASQPSTATPAPAGTTTLYVDGLPVVVPSDCAGVTSDILSTLDAASKR